jgi:carbon-monoxide dehydrogenase catalytic subunit
MSEMTKSTIMETVWGRSEQQEPRCGFGELGICCRMCHMGPCRIDPFGQGAKLGVCGATPELIVVRNFCRMIAGGSAAHSDHGRSVAKTLLLAAQNLESGCTIKDASKLNKAASDFGVDVKNKTKEEISVVPMSRSTTTS